MSSIADDDNVIKVALACDVGETLDLLLGVDGIGFGDDVGVRDPFGKEVVAAYSTFGFTGVLV